MPASLRPPTQKRGGCTATVGFRHVSGRAAPPPLRHSFSWKGLPLLAALGAWATPSPASAQPEPSASSAVPPGTQRSNTPTSPVVTAHFTRQSNWAPRTAPPPKPRHIPSARATSPVLEAGAPKPASKGQTWFQRLEHFLGQGQHPPEQWNTGTLFAPFPALPEQGEIVIEPYNEFYVPNGAFNARGDHVRSPGQASFTQFWFMQYAVTDRLTVGVYPTWSRSWGNHQKSSSFVFNDLPIDLEYRLTPHYTPSLTAYIGTTVPTGPYKNLSNPADGLGTGSWFLHYALQGELVFPFFSQTVRFHFWAQAYQPLTSARLKGMTAYGTSPGYLGHAHPGWYGNEGMGSEWGITKKWVFALDFYHTWGAGAVLRGRRGNQRLESRSGWNGTLNVGPELEYNWDPNWGVVAGVIVPVMGHNSSASLQPQMAISSVF
ncbi:hypothetical protein E3E12_00090 [Formicincola oecophyllae]|uniref:Uncharacterized protein n=1 Tax=Formicincola oecophyllae TaxID=2558361 RepID=A0A4Y6U8G9_9PROT|nr:hypothetical protein [Formicincola oecophyllae]QDH12868.1 hypothetical protein E3E12_00090 [Formicincola oecophyllae]